MASAKKALVTAHENIMWLHKYSVYTGSALVGVALMFAVTANAAPQPDVTNAQLNATLQSISTKLSSLENTVRQQCRGTAATPVSTTPSAPAATPVCDILAMTGIITGTGSMASENPIGTFTVRNNGTRSATIKKLMFEVSGAYDSAHGFGPSGFKLDRADPTTGARVSNVFLNGAALTNPKMESGTCGGVTCGLGQVLPTGAVPNSGAVLSFDIGSMMTEEVGAGSSKGYVIVANTTNMRDLSANSSATTQIRMKSMTASGMENAVSCDASKTMLVDGKVLTY